MSGTNTARSRRARADPRHADTQRDHFTGAAARQSGAAMSAPDMRGAGPCVPASHAPYLAEDMQ